MKIYDIIAEDKDLLEAPFGLDNVLKLGSRAVAKPKAVKELAELWKAEIIAAERTGIKPKFEVPKGRIPDEFAKDPAVLKAARIEADKLAKLEITAAQKAQVAAHVSEIGKGIYAGWTKAKLLAKIALMGWTGFEMIVDPIWNYMIIMNAMEQDLKAKKMEADEYEANRQNEMSIMLGTIARNMLAVGVVWGPMKFVNLVFGRVPGLGAALRGISLAGQGALLKWLNENETAQEMTATLMVWWIIPELVGGAGVTAANWLKSILPKVLGGTDADAERTAAVKKQQGRGEKPTDDLDLPPAAPAGKATALSPELERTPAAPGQLPGIKLKTDLGKVF